jgi:flagellar hook-length control protein FliK
MSQVFSLMSMGMPMQPRAETAAGITGTPTNTAKGIRNNNVIGGFLSALMAKGQNAEGVGQVVSGKTTGQPVMNETALLNQLNLQNAGGQGENATVDSLFSILQLAMKLGLIEGGEQTIGKNPGQELNAALDQLSFNADGTLIINEKTLVGLSKLKQLYLSGDTPADIRQVIDSALNDIKSVKPSPDIMLSAIEQSMNDQLGLSKDQGESVEIHRDQNSELLAAFEDVPARPAGDWADHFALMVQAGEQSQIIGKIEQAAKKTGLDTQEFLAAGIATGQITVEQVTQLAQTMPTINVGEVKTLSKKLTAHLEDQGKSAKQIPNLREAFDQLKADQKLAKETEAFKKNASVERQQVQGDLLKKADLKQAAAKAMEIGQPAPTDGASADDIIQQFQQILGQANKANGPQQATQMMQAATQMGRVGQPHPATEMVNLRIQKAMVNQETHFKMQLHPKELGRVDVQLQFAEDGKLMTIISADRADTLNLLQKDAANLHRMLQNAGLNSDAGGMEFNLRGEQDPNNGQGEFGQRANGYPDGGADELSAQDVMAAIDHNQEQLIALGRIDLTV